MTIEDIQNISFRRANLGGYKPEEVDLFIDNVQETFQELIEENNEVKRKLAILAKKIEEYKLEEDSIRTTLLNAQKLASASIREAKHKSEVIVADATVSAERIISKAKEDIVVQKTTINRLKKEVIEFKTRLLSVYKDHLKLIDAMPNKEDFKEVDTYLNNNEDDEVLEQKMDFEDVKFDDKDENINNGSTKQERFSNSSEENQEIEQITKEVKVTDKTEKGKQQNQKEKKYTTINFDAIKFGEDYDLTKKD